MTMHEFKFGTCTVCTFVYKFMHTIVQNVHSCMTAHAQGALLQQLIELMKLFVA